MIGRLEIRTDSRGSASESEYDKGGRLVASRRYLPDGRLADQTSYEYDAAGRQIATVDIDGNRSETVYDEFGRVVESIANAGTENELSTTYEYDAGGRQVATVDVFGNRTVTTRAGCWFDCRLRCEARINARGRRQMGG